MSDNEVAGPQGSERPLAPTLWAARREWRMALELVDSALRTRDVDGWPTGDGHPVLVLPGFLAGPESTVFLRKHLRRLGYRAHDWRHGRNLGITPELSARLEDLLLELYDRYGRAVSLVGWSAGGIYAREMARTLPHYTRQVITLGSPFNGHPESTRAWHTYRLLNRGPHHDALFTEEACRRRASPLEVPTTSIYSRSDGIVAWECCVAEPAPRTENIEVRATHLGYGHQLETLRVIADRLAQPEGSWTPYAGHGSASRAQPAPVPGPRATAATGAHPVAAAGPPVPRRGRARDRAG